MKNICKKLFKFILNIFGFEIRRIARGQDRMSRRGALLHIKEIGFRPRTVIEVGAAFGGWTRMCSEIFPNAHYFLFEPLKEYNNECASVISNIKGAKYFNCAVGSTSRNAVINVHDDLVGSSRLKETEGEFADGKPRNVRMVTLDEVILKNHASGPFLIKIDVQGGELEVLSGAKEVLKETEYIILEVSFFQTMIGGPQIFDVVKFMNENGFALYDIISCLYRPLDNALCQAHVAFVKENGLFRRDHRYCTPPQRKKQNKQFVEKIAELKIKKE